MSVCCKSPYILEQTCSIWLQTWLIMHERLLPPGAEGYFVRKEVGELNFCSGFRNTYLNGFTTSIILLYHLFFHDQGSFFSSIRVFTYTDDSQDSRGREETIFYSTLPLPPAHDHWDIYLQLCKWDEYHVFLIATLVFTRLLLDEIYHLIELPIWVIDWWCNICLFTWWIDTKFLLQRFDIGNRWMWARIEYQPCIASEPTKQVC